MYTYESTWDDHLPHPDTEQENNYRDLSAFLLIGCMVDYSCHYKVYTNNCTVHRTAVCFLVADGWFSAVSFWLWVLSGQSYLIIWLCELLCELFWLKKWYVNTFYKYINAVNNNKIGLFLSSVFFKTGFEILCDCCLETGRFAFSVFQYCRLLEPTGRLR